MPVNRRGFTGICFALALSAAGCGLIPSGEPSSVAQGKHYASGNARFDDFFLSLHRMQVEMARAPEELAEARAELANTVLAEPEAPSKRLAEKVHGELQKLVPRGIRVKIEVQVPEHSAREGDEAKAPEPAGLVRTSGRLRESDRRLLARLQASTTRLARLAAKARQARERLNALRLLALQLEGQVDEAFDLGNLEKRREVRENLDDGIKVIALMTDRAKDLEQQSGDLLDALVSTAGTDDGSASLVPLEDAARAETRERPAKARPRRTRRRARDDDASEPSRPEPKSTEFEP